MLKLQKCKNTIFSMPKNFQTCQDGIILQKEQLYFWEGVQFQTEIELNAGSKSNLNLV
jgi:hypothetical protein